MPDMRTYELVLILPPEFTEEEQNKVLAKIQKLISEDKGKIVDKTSWGKKEFSYPIAKKPSGIYWFLNLELNPQVAVKLSNQLKITEQVMRHLLIKKEEVKK